MILADKIIMLRKKNGWSQEELANRLDISRQSVSKWESGASIPDLDKIIKLSSLFSVSTDYLLKEENEELAVDEGMVYTEAEKLPEQVISVEEAQDFLSETREYARMIGLGVALCILSPIAVILLATMAEAGILALSEDFAGGIGAIVLLVMVAVAVSIFVLKGIRYEKYDYLTHKTFVPGYGMEGLVAKQKESFLGTFSVCITIGVGLCILSVIPVIFVEASGGEDLMAAVCVSIFLAAVAGAVFLFIWAGIIRESFDKLLQEGKYLPENKNVHKKGDIIAHIYWSIVTAGYLLWSFTSRNWGYTWIVWPVAGVLWAAIAGIVRLFADKNKEV